MGFAVILALALIERAKSNQLERFADVSAVGDAIYFDRRTAVEGAAVASLNGTPLHLTSTDKTEIRDTKMKRVARDAATGLGIYQLRESAGSAESDNQRRDDAIYFLKVGRNDFVKVKRGAPPE